MDTDPEHPLRLTRDEPARREHPEHPFPGPCVPFVDPRGCRGLRSRKGTIDGHADFLAEPFPAVNAEIALSEIRLADLRPVVARSNLELKGGTLSLAGRLEYGPKVRTVDLKDLDVRGIRVDYVHTKPTAPAEAERVARVGKAVRAANRDPETTLRVGRIAVVDSELGYVDREKDPGYRLFLSHTNIEIQNASNGFRSGEAVVAIHGLFMGKGNTSASGKLGRRTPPARTSILPCGSPTRR